MNFHSYEIQLKGNCGGFIKTERNWKNLEIQGNDRKCYWWLKVIFNVKNQILAIKLSFKASKNDKIEIELITLIMPCKLACIDYLEIKYKNNFEQTGARYSSLIHISLLIFLNITDFVVIFHLGVLFPNRIKS